MRLLSITAVLVITIFIRNSDANCPVVDNPTDVIECLSYITTGAYGIAVRDLKKICRIASDIARCARGQMGSCIASEIGRGALAEIEKTASLCCPNRNANDCPLRDENIQDQRCFSADSIVTLANQQKKTVAQLQPGDAVLAFDQSTKTVLQTQVISMLDYQPQRFALFKQITTVTGRQLSLSSSHLVLTASDDYLMAKEIHDGMEIFVMNDNGELVRDRVSNVSETVKQGYVAPLTNEGTILVNDVAASCYATIKSHRIAHAVLSPMRWWYWLFGSEKSVTATDQGVHWFPKMIYEITTYLAPSIIQK